MGDESKETIMSSEKLTLNKPDEREAMPASDTDNTLPGARKPLKVLAFEIDDNDDLGGDPYNHTGSFCVPEFDGD